MKSIKTDNSRIVITGMGCVNSLGDTPETSFQKICSGVSGISEIESFDVTNYKYKKGGEVKQEPYYGSDNKLLDMALKATTDAVNQANLGNLTTLQLEHNCRISIISGTLCGMGDFPKNINVDYLLRGNSNSQLCDELCDSFSIVGSRYTLSDACCTGLNIIQNACNLLHSGEADVVICVASELLTEYLQCVMGQLRVLAKDDVRPFDKQRSGTIIGEGSASIVIETLAHAKKRKVQIISEIAGIALGCEAQDMATPDITGNEISKVMDMAIKSADMNVEDIQYINAHGNSTKMNDKAEAAAINLLFKDVCVSSTKSSIGHLCAASGLMETVICIMALQTGILPPTINYTTTDSECNLNLILDKGKKCDVNVILTNSFGFGGNNASMVLKKYLNEEIL